MKYIFKKSTKKEKGCENVMYRDYKLSHLVIYQMLHYILIRNRH